ncbi:hypothetical protein AQ490_11105 [Wenjunlia vitaminophila]|uniref:FAD-binding domain-containing protein n=1 Tax=Wenjunlia vitaminophila TaxID=76728 RepID=A0A0T6LK25_WENVI|nr:FAD-dependent monooxygenase [Wenjunlia vitaminophila]KRV46445.1 hypothetical protein AQ490_11105 [Wenjunlia vitaminophila]
MAALPTRTDVLIVGAGPTGLALASTLATAEVPFVAVDQVDEGANYSRAVGTLPRTLQMLDQLQVAERLAKTGNQAQRIRAFSGDRDRTIATLHVDRLATPYPFAVVMPQHHTEEALLGRLRELGGRVHRPWRLTALTQDEDGVTATLQGSDGERHTLWARYAVGADGARSAVRRYAGVAFPGETFRQSFLLADLLLSDGPPPDEIHLFFSRHGAVIMGRMPSGLHRVCISVDQVPEQPLSPQLAQELLRLRAPESHRIRVREVVGSSHTKVHHRIAERFRAGRIFLAGDAAHLNSPIVGQGMNLGIQDGITLGNTLVSTLRDGVDTLDDYERVRRQIAKEAVEFTRRINDLATAKSPSMGAVRDRVAPLVSSLPPVNRRLIARLARVIDG